MHNGFVVDAEGEKMSKSLGNVSNLLDLIDVYDPRAYRMVLLQSHYRSPVEDQPATASTRRSTRSPASMRSPPARRAWPPTPTPDAEVLAEFRAAMDDDLDTPRATALIFDTVRRANAAFDAGDRRGGRAGRRGARDLRRRRSRTRRCRPTCRPTSPTSATALDEARAERDFARADAIRAELQAAGWTVETTKDGTTIRR